MDNLVDLSKIKYGGMIDLCKTEPCIYDKILSIGWELQTSDGRLFVNKDEFDFENFMSFYDKPNILRKSKAEYIQLIKKYNINYVQLTDVKKRIIILGDEFLKFEIGMDTEYKDSKFGPAFGNMSHRILCTEEQDIEFVMTFHEKFLEKDQAFKKNLFINTLYLAYRHIYDYLLTFQNIGDRIYKKDGKIIIYLNNSKVPINNFRFIPQCTIKIKYIDVIDVISNIYTYNKRDIGIAKLFINHIEQILNIFSNINLAKSWLFLVVLNYINYIRFNQSAKTSHFKNSCPIFIRHSLSEMFPFSESRGKLGDFYNAIQKIVTSMPSNVPELVGFGKYVEILIDQPDRNTSKIMTFNNTENGIIKQESTFFDFLKTPQPQIVSAASSAVSADMRPETAISGDNEVFIELRQIINDETFGKIKFDFKTNFISEYEAMFNKLTTFRLPTILFTPNSETLPLPLKIGSAGLAAAGKPIVKSVVEEPTIKPEENVSASKAALKEPIIKPEGDVSASKAAEFSKACQICGKKENTKACSICKSVFYCGADHQRKDWAIHKQQCKKPGGNFNNTFLHHCY